jgi:hypothetical protein
MTARVHHYIPQLYLRGFTAHRKKGKPRLCVFDRQSGTSFEAALDKIGAERDFNRVEIEGHPPDALEAALARFEGHLAPALVRTIAAGEFQSAEDRAYVLNLVGLLILRNPRWREVMRKIQEDGFKLAMNASLSTKERWERLEKEAIDAGHIPSEPKLGYDDARKLFHPDNYEIDIATDRHIEMEFKLFDTILPYLWDRRWWFIRASQSSGGFVTSDHPATLIWSDPAVRGGPSPGLGMRRTQLIFPLSNRLALIGAFEIEEKAGEAPEELVEQINGTTILNTTRQVYARDTNFRYRISQQQGSRKASKLIAEHYFRINRDHREVAPNSAAEKGSDEEVEVKY